MTEPAPTPARTARAGHWYKDAIIYEVHVRAFSDSDGDGIGDFRGLTQQLDYLAGPGRHGDLAAAVLPLAAARRRLRHRGLPRRAPGLRHAARLPHVPARRPRPRPAGDHRARAEPHLGPAPVVPARPPGRARQPRPQLLRLERHARPLHRRAHHLQGLRDLQLDLGPGRRRVLLAPLLLPPARPELRQSGGAAGDVQRRRLLARDGRRRAAAGRGALPVRARGHELREPARDARRF